MKFTKSKDGRERCTVRFELRLTRDEYAEIAEIAKKVGSKSVKAYLEPIVLDGEYLYNAMSSDKDL